MFNHKTAYERRISYWSSDGGSADREALRRRDHLFPLAAHALKLARDSIADGVPRDAAFMIHQAVERVYNAVLLVRTLYAPKSHRLGILRSLAEDRKSTRLNSSH